VAGVAEEERRDVCVVAALDVGLIAWKAVIPFDPERHGWSRDLPLWMKAPGGGTRFVPSSGLLRSHYPGKEGPYVGQALSLTPKLRQAESLTYLLAAVINRQHLSLCRDRKFSNSARSVWIILMFTKLCDIPWIRARSGFRSYRMPLANSRRRPVCLSLGESRILENQNPAPWTAYSNSLAVSVAGHTARWASARAIDRAARTVPGLGSIEVVLDDATAEIPVGVVLWVHRDEVDPRSDATHRDWIDWMSATFPPEVCQHYALLSVYHDHGR
jgi:hypothetical protein